jgi:uncharacterized protein (TIGR01732 family)
MKGANYQVSWLKGVNTNERSWWIWTSFCIYFGYLCSVSHNSCHFHNLIGSLSWKVRIQMSAVGGFGRHFAFILVLFILLVIILTGICVI